MTWQSAVKPGVRISIVILDQFGEAVYFYRMDGQGKINIETAFMKARTVLNTRQPSKATMNQVLTGRSSEARQISFGNFPNSGALQILINGNQFIGAMGVGGSAPARPEWSDEICARRALTKIRSRHCCPTCRRARGPGSKASILRHPHCPVGTRRAPQRGAPFGGRSSPARGARCAA
jgi:uncharacterized protein GlcG (DUF336 family)